MPTGFPDGAEVYREAYFRGLRPDPDVWIDQWADEYMRIPRDTLWIGLVRLLSLNTPTQSACAED
jgi:hypothetical protein